MPESTTLVWIEGDKSAWSDRGRALLGEDLILGGMWVRSDGSGTSPETIADVAVAAKALPHPHVGAMGSGPGTVVAKAMPRQKRARVAQEAEVEAPTIAAPSGGVARPEGRAGP